MNRSSVMWHSDSVPARAIACCRLAPTSMAEVSLPCHCLQWHGSGTSVYRATACCRLVPASMAEVSLPTPCANFGDICARPSPIHRPPAWRALTVTAWPDKKPPPNHHCSPSETCCRHDTCAAFPHIPRVALFVPRLAGRAHMKPAAHASQRQSTGEVDTHESVNCE